MERQRWDTIREIFDAALELPASERDSYIRSASGGDPDVCSEVSLLLKAEEDIGDFLEAPMASGSPFGGGLQGQPPLQPGEVLCDRFRILRMVGEGGMGYVFEAWDLELGRPVALKTIRPEIANQPEALKRFRREVSVALAITHPNVCRTFDIEREVRVREGGASQAIIFLTMEFLEGETLSARIARNGPFPLDQALTIAGQIADALGSAHELGILHRDIKPANVMLTGPASQSASTQSPANAAMRVVITDFGLARQEAIFRAGDHSAISRSGFPAGTLAYMAPEQLGGEATSTATDVYAFGLVLFEMVTGRRAFPSSSPLSGIRHRLAGPPPSPQILIPDLPESWSRAIEGCLRINPADRYQNVADVIEVLHGGRVALPRVTRSSHAPSTRRGWLSSAVCNVASLSLLQRIAAAAIFLLLVVSLSYGVVRLYQSRAVPKVKAGDLVYLTQVKNETGEKTFDNLTELIQAGLTQSAQINLLDQGRVGDTLQHMTRPPDTVITEPIARDIAWRTGSVRVIFATITGANGDYKLSVDIQRPDSTPSRYRNRWPRDFRWHAAASTNTATIPAELLTAVRDTTEWIRQQVGESQDDIGRLSVPPEDVTTGNSQALAEYSQGQEFLRRNQTDEAIHALQRAVQLDPHFALAYARLGDTLATLLRDEEAYDAYTAALNDGDSRLTRREMDRIRGMFAIDTWDYREAEASFRNYTAYFPSDPIGYAYQALPLRKLNQMPQAIDALEKVHKLQPGRPFAPEELAGFYTITGNFTEARKSIAELHSLGAHDTAQEAEANILFLEKRYDESERTFQSILHSDDSAIRSNSYARLARIAVSRDRLADAVRYLSLGIQDDDADGHTSRKVQKLLDRGYLYCQSKQFSQCLADFRLALSLAAGMRNFITAITRIGAARPYTPGDTRRELSVMLVALKPRLPKQSFPPITDFARSLLNGEILMAEDRPEAAIAEFRKAAANDAPADSKWYLARALSTASTRHPNGPTAHAWRAEAKDILAEDSLHTSMIWHDVQNYCPGFVATTNAMVFR